jgi:formylglycine-generating enzyme required for sulfatase activity
MVYVPAGIAVIGTSNDQILYLVELEEWAERWYEKGMFRIEQPQHRVEMPHFEISRFAVTNEQYFAFAWETGYRMPKHWGGFNFPAGEGHHPVTGVSKIDADHYVDWLNKKTGSNYRLPTEYEWEYAARGSENRVFPWGNEFDPWRCNTLESGKRGTTEVEAYTPGGDSWCGVADMMGNVAEWTNSKLIPYLDNPRDEMHKNANHVLRGGSWYYSWKLARCSAREGAVSYFVSNAVGFRLARTIDPNKPYKQVLEERNPQQTYEMVAPVDRVIKYSDLQSDE